MRYGDNNVEEAIPQVLLSDSIHDWGTRQGRKSYVTYGRRGHISLGGKITMPEVPDPILLMYLLRQRVSGLFGADESSLSVFPSVLCVKLINRATCSFSDLTMLLPTPHFISF